MSTTPHPEGPTPGPAHVPTAIPYYPSPPPRRRSFLGRLLFALFVMVFIGSLLMNFLLAGLNASLLGEGRVQEKFVSHNRHAADKVAILPIEGVILESEDGFVKRAIDTAMEDENVRAIVLRIDSPGGSVAGSDYLYHHLCKLRDARQIPIVVSMGGIAASGGYYVSMAVGDRPNTIYAEPTGYTGSIGVIMPHYDISGLMEEYKIVDDSVPSNPLKEMGSITKKMNDKEKDIFRKLVDDSFVRFKEVVKEGRPYFKQNPAKLDEIATGQVYTTNQAVEKKLIDGAGFIEDAVDKAIELAKLDKQKVKVVRYKSEPSLSSVLLGGESRAARIDLKTLLDAATPRAYYLVSGMPALAGTVK